MKKHAAGNTSTRPDIPWHRGAKTVGAYWEMHSGGARLLRDYLD